MDDPGSVTAPADPPDRRARLAGLMEAARDGSDHALGQIVTELSPLLWQVARATGLSRGDAEDVLQTVWTLLVAHLDGIRQSSALTSWLVTTTRREAWRVKDAGRRQLPADSEWLSALPDQRPGSEEQVIMNDQHRALWTAFRQLSSRCQELLRMVAAGHTNAQIARRVSVSEGTVRIHLQNIYTRLQVSSRTAAVTRAFPDCVA